MRGPERKRDIQICVLRAIGLPRRREGASDRQGEPFPAKFGRTGFRRNFRFDQHRHGRQYHTKQVEAYAVQEGPDWLVIIVVTCDF